MNIQKSEGPGLKENRPNIMSFADLDNPHPIIAIARDQLRAAKKSPNGSLETDPATAPSIRTAPENVDRFLRILDAMIKVWESKDGKVQITETTDGARICFVLGEHYVRFEMDEYSDSPSNGPPAQSRPTIWLFTQYNISSPRERWSENKSTALEKFVRPALDAAETHLKAVAQKHLDDACRVRQREKAEARLQQDADSDAQAIILRQELLVMANRWHDAQRVRALLLELRRKLGKGELKPRDTAKFEAWLRWAESYANCIDPTINGVTDDPDRADIERHVLADLDLTYRTRQTLIGLEIKDSDGLAKLSEAAVRESCGYGYNEVWRELTDVLAGLGYDTRGRKDYLW